MQLGTGRNPQAGKEVGIPAVMYKVPGFRASKSLKDVVN
ncbi:MAG: HU family DNA-binding protein [Symbiopectobacterium sp.]